VRQGEGRSVACFLRGSCAPYPRRDRQGTLEITSSGLYWHGSWGFGRRTLTIAQSPIDLEVRDADKTHWNVKKGGKAFGVLPVPAFRTIVCTTDAGVIELTVPQEDAPLVRAALERQSQRDS
jgi:hypothetical protein